MWLRTGRDNWQQYVGRRVRRLRVGKDSVYLAFAGRTFCGRYERLEQALLAAEKSHG